MVMTIFEKTPSTLCASGLSPDLRHSEFLDVTVNCDVGLMSKQLASDDTKPSTKCEKLIVLKSNNYTDKMENNQHSKVLSEITEIIGKNCKSHSKTILVLLTLDKYQLCSSYLDILIQTEQDLDFDDNFKLDLIQKFDDEWWRIDNQREVLQIITNLPNYCFEDVLLEIFPSLTDEVMMKMIVDYYLERCQPLNVITMKHVISYNIYMNFNNNYTLWDIVSNPFLVFEVLLMNQDIDTLKTIIRSIRPLLSIETCDICKAYTNFLNLGSFGQDHREHPYTASCFNRLLMFYAEHSIDVQIVNSDNNSNMSLERTELGFYLPPKAPLKSEWIPDEAVQTCMCCKLMEFTMVKRRHHCRRCGRVVCSKCSKKRMRIPGMFKNVPVRTCDDCLKFSDAFPTYEKLSKTISTSMESIAWSLNGIKSEDTEVRLQFGYPDSPSASLCLEILSLHTNDTECCDFLFKQCKSFEDHLRPIRAGQPNPEIDYGLMAKIMRNIALAGKMRGGSNVFDEIICKADIISTVVQRNLEHLLPIEKLRTSDSMRKLRDNLLQAEVYDLALDLSVKCGFPRNGVLQAWGLQGIKIVDYFIARDRLGLCLNKIISEAEANRIAESIIEEEFPEIPNIISRPKTNPKLLDNILIQLEDRYDVDWERESLYFLFLSGSHEAILYYLIKCRRFRMAFSYILSQKVDFECFMNAVVLNKHTELIETEMIREMWRLDETFIKWKPYIQQLCGIYEKKNILVGLYNIQSSMGDHVRAAMTSVQLFYNNCPNYRSHLGHLDYLQQAAYHMNQDLETKTLETVDGIKTTIKMSLEAEKVEYHIKVIELQKKISLFFAPYEESDPDFLLNTVSRLSGNTIETPITLFDNELFDYLMALLVLCDAAKGYELILEVLELYPAISKDDVHKIVIESLAHERQPQKIISYIKVVRKHNDIEFNFDKCILEAVKIISKIGSKSINRSQLEQLINMIGNLHWRIEAFIYGDHLKTAYLLSVKHKERRLIKRVAQRADSTDQTIIKRLCDKHLSSQVY